MKPDFRHLTLAQVEQLLEQNAVLQDQLAELQLLHETIVEHSTTIENELEDNNATLNRLLGAMRKYLSPQLYESIVGGETQTTLNYKRKFLTIFFSDIVGFTEVTDMIDPELLSELLNQYLNEMSKIALDFGGTIDKFIGDAIMIFFGDPIYQDDQTHARQCLMMAIKMQQKIAELDHVWQARGIKNGLSVRMGIHSGYCTVGNFGSDKRMDYTIIGGNVNIASRLETFADPSSIFISRATFDLVKDLIQTTRLGEVKVKGVHFAIEVFKVLGLNNNAPTPDTLLTADNDTLIFKGFSFRKEELNPDTVKLLTQTLQQAIQLLNS
ncbi:MAG TPA: adenylate/guanylate cyclase domain-containing protein [Chitinophagales bacterium]|nr:adenylate/guanylate cyclase domain-containing protein [Chitinophagales bacterium]HRK27910.1 adenylate/guanylate cyclase domain-containing protein [Chitinophagales bacterium]